MKKEKMTVRCEFGCDCDTVFDFKSFETVLDRENLKRLIEEKMARAQRYAELQQQFKIDSVTD